MENMGLLKKKKIKLANIQKFKYLNTSNSKLDSVTE